MQGSALNNKEKNISSPKTNVAPKRKNEDHLLITIKTSVSL